MFSKLRIDFFNAVLIEWQRLSLRLLDKYQSVRKSGPICPKTIYIKPMPQEGYLIKYL